ncbi:TIP41-like family domain-containing protein [Ditylenchus destructor]|nr:TIP41-like family domain-containing protein [Ditylenchus destructor]
MTQEKPRKSTRTEERYVFDERVEFYAVQDHILESKCTHVEGKSCQFCKFEKELSIPHLPEMIFAENRLQLRYRRGKSTFESFIEFNAFDALREVEVGKLPDVKVGPSSVWQEARKEMPLREFQRPFDWTYTSNYKGTVGPNVRVESTEETINIDKLKERVPIVFYTEQTLYEDELADHGCSQMSVRVRVMPTCFLVLCRFYLRVDHVMVRMCDTRIFGEAHKPYVIREWVCREANYGQLSKSDLMNVLDGNLIWPVLPQVTSEMTKLTCCDMNQ